MRGCQGRQQGAYHRRRRSSGNVRTWNTPPSGEAPNPMTDTSSPVLPSSRRGTAAMALLVLLL